MISKSVKATKGLAQKLAKELPARIYALVGELGSGKTTFVQAFLRAWGVRGPITSPTFLIIKRFMIYDLRFKNAYHIDAYRIKNAKELLALGLKEILANKQNIVLIEWAEKVKNYLPKETLWLEFKDGRGAQERIITY